MSCCRGFTLMELMFVIIIVAILASIAYPSYESYMQRTRRADAQIALLELAGRMEGYYAANRSYSGATVAGLLGSTSSENGYYTLSIALTNANQAYTLTATAAGTQTSDSACGNFTYTSVGVKGVTGDSSVAKCW